MNYKSQIKKAAVIMGLFLIVPLSGFAAGEVALSEFTNSQPAILPNNPFYALKSGFQRILSGQSIVGALNLIDSRAAEVFTSNALIHADARLMTKALRSYRDGAKTLTDRLSRLDVQAIGAVGSVEYNQFFAQLNERLFIHLRFTRDLETGITVLAEQKLLDEIRQEMTDAALISLGGLGDIDAFIESFIVLHEGKDPFFVLRNAETLSLLTFELTQQDAITLHETQQLFSLAHTLFTEIAHAIETSEKNMSGEEFVAENDQLIRLYSLTHLSELATSDKLSAVINRARFNLEMGLESSLVVSAKEVAPAIQTVLEYADSMLASTPAKPNAVMNSLIERVEFYITQVAVLSKAGNHLGAYLQASLLSATTAELQLLLGL